MTTFHVQPMTPADYVDATRGLAPWEQPWESACFRLDHGDAWTGWVDGEIAAVAGILRPWPGVGEAWACLTDVGRAHPRFVVRRFAWTLREQIDTHGLRRVQADVYDDDVLARALVERLGFQEEGRMRRFGPNGEDFARYARITR